MIVLKFSLSGLFKTLLSLPRIIVNLFFLFLFVFFSFIAFQRAFLLTFYYILSYISLTKDHTRYILHNQALVDCKLCPIAFDRPLIMSIKIIAKVLSGVHQTKNYFKKQTEVFVIQL